MKMKNKKSNLGKSTQSKKLQRVPKSNKKINKKYIIIVLEIVLLVLLSIIIYPILTEDEKTDTKVIRKISCEVDYPEIDIYRNNEKEFKKLGKRVLHGTYTFTMSDNMPMDGKSIEVYTYTDKETLEEDKVLCDEVSYSSFSCDDNEDELTRTVVVENIYFDDIPNPPGTTEWFDSYMEILKEMGYQCKVSKK